MNRFHAKKPASKTHESKKTKPKATTASDAPSAEEPPPDRTPSDDGTTGIDDIIRQRQAEKQGRDEQTISGDTE